MPLKHRFVKNLTPAERLALRLLREALCDSPPESGAPADARAAFAALAGDVRQSGLTIGTLETPYVCPDELLLLAGITIQQRLMSGDFRFAREGLAERLALCGRRVRRLPMKPTTVALLVDAGWLAQSRQAAIQGATQRRMARDWIGTTRGQLIQFARGQERISSAELQAFGISRQYISRLHHSGVLDRVTFGYYRLSEAYAAPPLG